jgi:ABC-type transport system involved in cytochrome c biogenesis permease subunit
MGIWIPLTVSALSGAAFLFAMRSGWRLGEEGGGPTARRHLESRAARAAAAGFLLLLVAVILWVAYLIFGPVHDAATELLGRD